MNFTHDTIPGVTVLFDHKLKLVEQIVLASMFISAVIGNALVLIIMLNKQRRHITRMAFFILHLTIADLLVAFFSVLPMLIWKSTITFFGGDFLCRIVSFLMLAVSYISVYTLVVMANDRYQAIVHPLSSYTWTSRSGLSHMIGVWCLSLLLASPQLFIFRLAHHPAYEKETCMASFFGSNRTWELIYITWTIFIQFLLPICILIFCYSSVYAIVNRNISMYRSPVDSKPTNSTNLLAVELSKRPSNLSASSALADPTVQTPLNNHIHVHCPSVERPSLATVTFLKKSSSHHLRTMMYPVVFRLRHSPLDITKNSSTTSIDGQKSQQRHGAHHFLSRARLKTIKLTFIVVLTYILCSTPFYIGSIIMALNGKFMSQKTMNWLMTIFSLLFNLNSCSNPIICLTLSGTLLRCQNSYQRRQLPSPRSQTNYYNRRTPSKLSMSL